MTAHKNVFMALAAAQSEMEPVVKGAINPAFKGEGKPKGTPYADLADVLTAVLPALNKHGIALFHVAGRDDHGPVMTSILYHGESDTKIECPVPLIVGKNDMQGYKSATSYAKRIGTESVTGVAPDDDDGNAAAANPPKAEPRRAAPPPDAKPEAERTLTKAEGEAIIAALATKTSWIEIDEYASALESGPMAFAAKHPKIRAAIAERRAAVKQASPIVMGEIQVPEDNPFEGERIPF